MSFAKVIQNLWNYFQLQLFSCSQLGAVIFSLLLKILYNFVSIMLVIELFSLAPYDGERWQKTVICFDHSQAMDQSMLAELHAMIESAPLVSSGWSNLDLLVLQHPFFEQETPILINLPP